jgi:hypothetical protein
MFIFGLNNCTTFRISSNGLVAFLIYTTTLPKSREDTHAAIEMIDTMTSKNERFLIVNDQESGIIIFSTETNVTCLCNDVEELFIDGTFKCCARHFYQLYTIHGGKKGKWRSIGIFAFLLHHEIRLVDQRTWITISQYLMIYPYT